MTLKEKMDTYNQRKLVKDRQHIGNSKSLVRLCWTGSVVPNFVFLRPPHSQNLRLPCICRIQQSPQQCKHFTILRSLFIQIF